MRGFPKQENTTYQRLISVAEKLFAEKGYKGVSVREITSKAGVHLSAINYYFGSKENLYIEVFRKRFLKRTQIIRKDFLSRLSKSNLSPEIVIRSLTESVLLGPLTEEERKIHYKLLVREIAEPTKAWQLIMEEGIKPLFEEASQALYPFFPAANKESFYLAMFSLLAQIIHFNFARNMVQSLTGYEYDEAFKRFLVYHITCFSLKGLEGFKE